MVQITKSGIICKEWSCDQEQIVQVPNTDLIACLRDECAIDLDATLGDIFRVVETDALLCAFLSSYSSCPVDAFHAEAKMPPAIDPTVDDIDDTPPLRYLELSKYFEYGNSKTHLADISIHLSGISDPDERTDDNIHWGIDFTPVNQLVHLPVCLKPTMQIRKKHEKVDEVPCYFSLLEVLGEIYWEISFMGGPEERDVTKAELFSRIDEIKDGILETVPLETVFECEYCYDQGSGVYTECVCGRYRTVSGEVKRHIVDDLPGLEPGFKP